MRSRIQRPGGGSYTYACTTCLVVLDDGVEYASCPRCERGVDWVPLGDVWVCRACDSIVAGAPESSRCAACARSMTHLRVAPAASSSATPAPGRVFGALVLPILAVQAALALIAPGEFPYLRAWLFLAQLGALVVVVLLVIANRDIRDLVRDPRTRIIHGLEHATLKVLRERGFTTRGGCTYEGMFYVDLDHDGRSWDKLDDIRAAAAEAIRRIAGGEHGLAYSPTCGTSWIVGRLLVGLAIAGIGLVALVGGTPAHVAFALSVAGLIVARALKRPLGLLAQRWLTVSTAFTSATVGRVQQHVFPSGSKVRFTVEIDAVPRPRSGGLVAAGPLS